VSCVFELPLEVDMICPKQKRSRSLLYSITESMYINWCNFPKTKYSQKLLFELYGTLQRFITYLTILGQACQKQECQICIIITDTYR